MLTLQFSTTDALLSRAIRWLSFSWASHVDIVLPNGVLLGALTTPGVCLHQPPAGGYRRVERYAVDLPARPVLAFLRKQLGKPYDWTGVVGWAIRRDWHDPRHWFCSELVAAAFEAAGTPLLRAPQSRVTPQDLLMSPWLRPLRQARAAVIEPSSCVPVSFRRPAA